MIVTVCFDVSMKKSANLEVWSYIISKAMQRRSKEEMSFLWLKMLAIKSIKNN